MKTLGNIIWVVFGGLIWAIGLLMGGLICCLTIIFIPVGLQLFKAAQFVLWPFGKKFKFAGHAGSTVINVVWAILFGWVVALGELLTGALFCLTIIGIPFGLIYFRLAKFTIMPVGSQIMAA